MPDLTEADTGGRLLLRHPVLESEVQAIDADNIRSTTLSCEKTLERYRFARNCVAQPGAIDVLVNEDEYGKWQRRVDGVPEPINAAALATIQKANDGLAGALTSITWSDGSDQFGTAHAAVFQLGIEFRLRASLPPIIKLQEEESRQRECDKLRRYINSCPSYSSTEFSELLRCLGSEMNHTLRSRGGPSGDDGPAGVKEWRFQGSVYEEMPDKPWRMAKALWFADERTLDLSDLAEPVNGDRQEVPNSNCADQWASNARKYFAKHEIPISITRSGDTCTLKDKKF